MQAVRHRFDRETMPEPYEVRAAGLELGRINRLRRETPSAPRRRRMPTEDKVAIAVAVAFLVALLGGG